MVTDLAECDPQALERFQIPDQMEAEDEKNAAGKPSAQGSPTSEIYFPPLLEERAGVRTRNLIFA